MSELLRYLKVLNRNRVVLVVLPLVTMVTVYFLTREMPDQYKSQAQIATGLVDKSAQVLDGNQGEQESEINRKFESMIQMMLLKKMVDQVSYALILHDLTVPAAQVFRPDAEELEEMTAAERRQAVAFFRKKYQKEEELSLVSPQERKWHELLEELEFDEQSLSKKLTIYRKTNSDYITIEFEASDPAMAAFVANTLSQEFITYYSTRIANSNSKAVDFLYEVMMQKQAALARNMEILKNYKIENRVLNLNEQAKALYGQLADFETRRELIQRDIQAYSAAIRNVDRKFDPTAREYMEGAVSAMNQDIVVTKQRLKAANDAYVRTSFDPDLKPLVDSLRRKLDREIDAVSDKYAYNPMVVRKDLITQKLNMELSLEMALNSSTSIQREIDRLNRKFDGLVPNEAKVQEYESSIDIASKEYIEALQRYNEKRMGASFPMVLQLVEKAMPGDKQPSRKKILVLVSGLACLSFCLLVFFGVYYLDSSIRDSFQLANATGLPVLGHLNSVPGGLSRQMLWDDAPRSPAVRLFQSLIRSVRYELLDQVPDAAQVITVSSLSEKEGKTTVVLGLARAFTRINKKVLLIDGNSGHPELSAEGSEGRFPGSLREAIEKKAVSDLVIMGNPGEDLSLLEVGDFDELKDTFQRLRAEFDIILIEADPLNALNKAKEWVLFSDRLLMVFEAGKTIKSSHEPTLRYLESLEELFSGWVLNKKSSSS